MKRTLANLAPVDDGKKRRLAIQADVAHKILAFASDSLSDRFDYRAAGEVEQLLADYRLNATLPGDNAVYLVTAYLGEAIRYEMGGQWAWQLDGQGKRQTLGLAWEEPSSHVIYHFCDIAGEVRRRLKDEHAEPLSWLLLDCAQAIRQVTPLYLPWLSSLEAQIA